MDFDHRDGEVKKFNVAHAMRFSTLNALLREIAKCDIICSNCHRIRTHNRKEKGRLAKTVKAPVLETGNSLGSSPRAPTTN